MAETEVGAVTPFSLYKPAEVLAFAKPVPIPAGTIWVGLATDGTSEAAGFSYAKVPAAGAKGGGVSSPEDKPSDPFGVAEMDDVNLTLNLNYAD